MQFRKFLVALFVGFAACQSDFCDPELCTFNSTHIGCDHSGEFSSSCPEDSRLVGLSDSDIELILTYHNGFRNRIASGIEAGFSPASRMATMVNFSEALCKLLTL